MSDVVEYDRLVAFLKGASLFEIYRLSVAIENELDNPARIAVLANKIKIGDIVEYFEAKSNTFIRAIVENIGAKTVIVQDIDDRKRWKLPFHMLKIDSREFVFEKKDRGLNKNSIKVGDYVGFYHENYGKYITGRVERLNPKTVSIITTDKHKWRVSYQLLYAIIDGQQAESTLMLEASSG